MATIILSLSTKSDKVTSQHEVLIRFFHGKHVNQRTKTNVFVHPDHWSDATQSIIIPKWRTLSKERKQLKDELQQKSERLAAITSLVQSSFQEIDKGNVPNDWLKKLIHDFNFPAVTATAKPKPKQKKSFFDWFELFLKTKNYPHGSAKSFRVVERALGRYQGYKRKRNKDFALDIDTISKETIIDFFDYFRREHELAQKNPKLFEKLLRDYPAEITQKHKSPKITERGDNHIVNLQKKLKRFFLWLNKEGYSTNRPFDGVEIKAEKYFKQVSYLRFLHTFFDKLRNVRKNNKPRNGSAYYHVYIPLFLSEHIIPVLHIDRKDRRKHYQIKCQKNLSILHNT